MTKKQLVEFIRRRNNSQFNSNLQFFIDAGSEGIGIKDLGPATHQKETGDWLWHTKLGILREHNGLLSLEEIK